MAVEKSFKIKGMTCAACVRAVERAVKKKEGILDIQVNLATEKMSVKYNEEEISQEEIMETVSKAGYEALLDEDLKEVVIPVEGMT